MEHGRTMDHGSDEHEAAAPALRLPSLRLDRPSVTSLFGLGQPPVEHAQGAATAEVSADDVHYPAPRPFATPPFSARLNWADADDAPAAPQSHVSGYHAISMEQPVQPASEPQPALPHTAFPTADAPLVIGAELTGYSPLPVPEAYEPVHPVALGHPLPAVPEPPHGHTLLTPPASGLDDPQRWAVRYALLAYASMLLIVAGSVYYAWRV